MFKMITFLILIVITLKSINAQDSCTKICQNNDLCVEKCDEYSKNPNRHPLSVPHCGLSRLADNITDFIDQEVNTRFNNKPNWPWIVSFQYDDTPISNRGQRAHFCTGVIISENFILSAADCFPQEPGGIKIMMASNSLSEKDKNAQFVEIEALFVPGILHKPWIKKHEGHKPDSGENSDNILLVKTATKIQPKLKGNDFVINSICLPEPNYTPTGIVRIAGWKYQNNGDELVDIMLEVDNPLISNEMAEKVFQQTRHYYGDNGEYFVYNMTVQEKHVCTMASLPPGSNKYSPLAFNGDKGSSLVKIMNGRAFTVGVSKWISKGEPLSVWSRTSYYMEWLEENMKKTIWEI